jgi:hypothetical protein
MVASESLLAPWLRASRRNADFAAFDLASDLDHLASNGCRPFLQDCRNVTPLADDSHDGDESSRQGLVYDVVLTNGIQQQRSTTGEFMSVAERGVVLRFRSAAARAVRT